MREVRVLPDPAACGRAAAALLLDAVTTARAQGRAPVVAWPVGRTPLPVVDALAAPGPSGADLGDVHVLLVDDYVTDAGDRVSEASPVSCRGAAVRELLAPLRAALGAPRAPREARLHSPDPHDPSATEALVAHLGGLDLALVAVGASDGHVALNPPGTPADSRTRVVDLAPTTRQDNAATWGLASVEEVPRRGVTVGLGTLAGARRLVLLAHGAAKAATVARLLGGTGFDADLPASLVRTHPDAVALLDRAAAGEAAP